MKKILIALALVFSFNAVYAAEKAAAPAKKDWKTWYSNMLKGLKSKVDKKLESKTRVSAVAAVRGARQGGDAKALYWKGGVSDAARKKLEAEKKQLADAVQLVVDGDLAGGRAAMEKFIRENPESVYIQEAKEGLENLPAAEEVKPAAEAPKAEAAPEKGEEPAEKPAEKTGN
ncbi:MAG: hypothetical protein ACYC2I_07205 [Elusimicrobiales bacterium]